MNRLNTFLKGQKKSQAKIFFFKKEAINNELLPPGHTVIQQKTTGEEKRQDNYFLEHMKDQNRAKPSDNMGYNFCWGEMRNRNSMKYCSLIPIPLLDSSLPLLRDLTRKSIKTRHFEGRPNS